MLTRILEELRKSTEPVNNNDLARRLGIDRSALEGMLEQLVKEGKLRKVRQMTLQECQKEMEGSRLTLYGDLCAFMGPAESVVYYEITRNEAK